MICYYIWYMVVLLPWLEQKWLQFGIWVICKYSGKFFFNAICDKYGVGESKTNVLLLQEKKEKHWLGYGSPECKFETNSSKQCDLGENIG